MTNAIRRVGKILWARHGQNIANVTETFSYRVFDGELTELGRREAVQRC